MCENTVRATSEHVVFAHRNTKSPLHQANQVAAGTSPRQPCKLSATQKIALKAIPTARQLEQRVEEARAVAEQMRDPAAKHVMMNLALSYERLAKHAAMRRQPRQSVPRTGTAETTHVS